MKKVTFLSAGSIMAVLFFSACSSEKTPENVSAAEVEAAAASQMPSDSDKGDLEAAGKKELAEAEAKVAELAKKAEEESKKQLSGLNK